MLFLVSVGIFVLGLVIELRGDFYTWCVNVLVFSGVTALVTGVHALTDFGPNSRSVSVAVPASLVGLVCAAYVLRTQRAPSLLPDVLRKTFHRRFICEERGVQIAAEIDSDPISPGGRAFLWIYLQNSWATERAVEVVLRTDWLSPGREGLLFHDRAAVSLGGGAAGILGFPIVAGRQTRGDYILRPEIRVSGSGGIRVRRRRAKALSKLQHPILLLLGLVQIVGGSVFRGARAVQDVVRGDLKVVLRIDPSVGPLEESSMPGKPTWKILYVPEPDTLREARGEIAGGDPWDEAARG